MLKQHKELLSQVLELSPLDRAEFVEVLLTSFEFSSRKKIDALWAKEAEERIDAYDHGELTARPVEDVFADIRKGISR